MCEICKQTPCSSGCPNAELTKVCECEMCGADIYEGEVMFVIDDCNYCQDCIRQCKTYAELNI